MSIPCKHMTSPVQVPPVWHVFTAPSLVSVYPVEHVYVAVAPGNAGDWSIVGGSALVTGGTVSHTETSNIRVWMYLSLI